MNLLNEMAFEISIEFNEKIIKAIIEDRKGK